MENNPVLRVENLKTEFNLRNRNVYAVNGVSFHINAGEIVGLVGESGCGKSVTNMSVLRLLASPPARITSGSAWFDDKDLLQCEPDGDLIRSVRGGEISIIFQEPMTSLNPVLTVGEQIAESLRLHKGMSRGEARARVIELMKMVRIPDAESRYGQYPHQFSGGMCQRIMIAMALSCEPKILIADEATTALDVTIQAQILDLLSEIAHKTGISVLIITHNLGIIARYADRIYVLYAGCVCESGSADRLFKNPKHAYTVGLLNAIPRLDDDKSRSLVPIDGIPPNLEETPTRCPFYPRCNMRVTQCEQEILPQLREVEDGHLTACFNEDVRHIVPVAEEKLTTEVREQETLLEVKELKMYFPILRGAVHKKKIGDVKAVESVSLTLKKGATLGLVGESGCGKTTVAKTILRLYKPTAGSILFDGKDLTGLSRKEMRSLRKDIQFIFQDPFGSLDPRQKIGDIIGEPLIIHNLASGDAYKSRVVELLRMVGIDPSFRARYPHELSGGQRQRIGIARALASEPKLIICDEPVSALDVSVQAQILNLLEKLQRELGLAYLFIAHDLSVVRHISDEVAVMYLGHLVETGTWQNLYDNPQHPYTKSLLSAIPIPDTDIERQRNREILKGDIPSVLNIPTGCCFHTRCPVARPECAQRTPKLLPFEENHFVSCLLVNTQATTS